MLQMVLQVVPAIVAGIITYLVFRLVFALKVTGMGIMRELDWLLAKTPALDSFLMFVIQAVLAAMIIACNFSRFSNHTILTLDILYLFSIIMLILFHILKEEPNLSVRSI